MTSPIDRFVSVVAPLRNDAAILAAFVADTIGVLRSEFANYEIVLVDDGSADATADEAGRALERYECIRLIRLSRSFGEEIAITAGLDSVIGDYVVVMRPNYDPPGLIPQLVRRSRETGAAVVFGIPSRHPDQTLLTRVGSSIARVLAIGPNAESARGRSSQFRLLTRQAVGAVVRNRKRYRYLRMLSADIGFTSVGVGYDPIVRNPRRPRRSFWKQLRIATSAKIDSSSHPLRLATGAGVVASAVNLASLLWRSGDASGRMSLPVAGLFFLLFVAVAVLGEYVLHILVESSDRPLYHVLGERTSEVTLADRNRRNIAVTSVAAEE